MEEPGEKDQELIDRYVTGQADQEEIAEVARRRSDPDFAAQLAFAESTVRVARRHEEAVLRKEFQKIDTSATARAARPSMKKSWLWILLVIALGAIAYLLYTTFSPETKTPQEYYAAFYQPMPNLVSPIEQGDAGVTTYQEPFRSYERAEYAGAIRQFESLGIQDDAIRFYYALSLLAAGRADESVPYLETVKNSTAEFAQAAHWYLVLAHLKSGEMKAAEEELDRLLQNPSHRYRAQALALRSEMRH